MFPRTDSSDRRVLLWFCNIARLLFHLLLCLEWFVINLLVLPLVLFFSNDKFLLLFLLADDPHRPKLLLAIHHLGSLSLWLRSCWPIDRARDEALELLHIKHGVNSAILLRVSQVERSPRSR